MNSIWWVGFYLLRNVSLISLYGTLFVIFYILGEDVKSLKTIVITTFVTGVFLQALAGAL